MSWGFGHCRHGLDERIAEGMDQINKIPTTGASQEDATTAAPTKSAPPQRPRIVVGVDGSEASIGALRRGVRVATALKTSLEAVTAWQYPMPVGDYVPVDWSPENDAKLILTDAIHTVFGDNPPNWFSSTVVQGQPAQVLIEESDGAEMLIVGSRGHGGFVGLLLGSVSSACAEHARCPVLVLHDADSQTVVG